jgi:type I restriction enzyme M protein
MANGTLTTEQSGEDDIRRAMLEDDVVDCIVTLPGQLFFTTAIPVCLWFFSRARGGSKTQRKRTGEILFVNATGLGEMVSRRNRELTGGDIDRIADTYKTWKSKDSGGYEDVDGFCRSVALDEVLTQRGVLTPGRYVGLAEAKDDGEPYEEKMQRLVAGLADHFKRGAELEKRIRRNLKELGHEF